MIANLIVFLKSGSPPYYMQGAALLVFLIIEWALPRTKAVAANSLLELAANGLSRVPLVKLVAQKFATPAPAEPLPLPPPPKAGE